MTINQLNRCVDVLVLLNIAIASLNDNTTCIYLLVMIPLTSNLYIFHNLVLYLEPTNINIYNSYQNFKIRL